MVSTDVRSPTQPEPAQTRIWLHLSGGDVYLRTDWLQPASDYFDLELIGRGLPPICLQMCMDWLYLPSTRDTGASVVKQHAFD